jgi:hypothetical protein
VPLEILHRAAPCRNVPVTFTLDRKTAAVVSEALEAAGYFTFFWLFLFNRRFRQARIAEWREGGSAERAFLIFEASVSTLIGAVLPMVLLWGLMT